jgi:hypothetical protein
VRGAIRVWRIGGAVGQTDVIGSKQK